MQNKWDHLKKYSAPIESDLPDDIPPVPELETRKTIPVTIDFHSSRSRPLRKSGAQYGLILLVMAGACLYLFNRRDTSALAQSMIINDVGYYCSTPGISLIDCQLEIYDRAVHIFGDQTHGTGFILEGDEEYLTILTASHVISEEILDEVFISNRVLVTDIGRDVFEHAIEVCSFHKEGYADIGIIKIKNTTGTIYKRLETSLQSKPGAEVTIVEYRDPKVKKVWNYIVKGFLGFENKVVLYGRSKEGMSGSPIIDRQGALLGILTQGSRYFTFGTYRLDNVLTFGIDYLVKNQNAFTPYYCKKHTK